MIAVNFCTNKSYEFSLNVYYYCEFKLIEYKAEQKFSQKVSVAFETTFNL